MRKLKIIIGVLFIILGAFSLYDFLKTDPDHEGIIGSLSLFVIGFGVLNIYINARHKEYLEYIKGWRIMNVFFSLCFLFGCIISLMSSNLGDTFTVVFFGIWALLCLVLFISDAAMLLKKK